MSIKSLRAEERKNKVYRYICEHYRTWGYGPTYTEIMQACQITSRGHLNYMIDRLVADGRLEMLEGGWRNIRPVGARQPDRARSLSLPYLGAIPADARNPLELLDVVEDSVDMDASLLPQSADRSRCYVLTVVGDSMAEAHILDGDWVVIERRDAYNESDIFALYLKDQNAVTLKRLQPARDGTVVLEAESHKHPNRVELAENVEILGRVVVVMRKCY